MFQNTKKILKSAKKEVIYKKNFRVYGSANPEIKIFHDLLISHFIIITFIVYR